MDDYIPTRDADFAPWFLNFVSYVELKTNSDSSAWPDIPGHAIGALYSVYNDWHVCYERYLLSPAPVETAGKNNARRRAEAVLRLFTKQFLRAPPVTDGDRASMGILNGRDVQHSDVTEHLEISLRVNTAREISVRMKVQGALHNTKPTGYDGAVLLWDTLDKPPAGVRQLTRHAMASRPSFTLRFGEAERGKIVYIAGAWQNSLGIVGPYSEIRSAVVP